MRIAIVHEARADFEIATGLADRVFVEAIEWLEPEHLDSQREWIEHSPEGRSLKWTAINALAEAKRIFAFGHFDDGPAEPDAATARRAILYLRHAFPDLAAIVLVRDQDNQPARREGLRQARNSNRLDVEVVIGFARTERECWVICGFDPQDDAERALLGAEHASLGSDPRVKSHELTAGTDDHALRSPKRVLRQLSGDNRERERACWETTSLQTLHDRGRQNGLSEYLDEVWERLAQRIGHATPVWQ